MAENRTLPISLSETTRPQDSNEGLAHLLSEESSFITGQNFVIDGGMTKKMIYSE